MIRINDFRVPFTAKEPLEELVAKRLKLPLRDIAEAVIVRKGLDARRYKGRDIEFVYILDIKVNGDEKKIIAKLSRDKNIKIAPKKEKSPLNLLKKQKNAKDKASKRPVVVGFGPAGMLAAYALSKAGLCPLVLERGADVDERRRRVNEFWQGGAFSPQTNVQFGEGGAGTFSDGKLTTRISDPLIDDVLDLFVKCGAPSEIKYLHKPHIGTDKLAETVKNIRQEIIALGGEVRFNSQVTDIETKGGEVSAVIVNEDERTETSCVFLAIGHSARDTYKKLYERGVTMEAKAFAVGVRIEHPQDFIDLAQYKTNDERLPVADYALTYKDETSGRGAYSFCMCPGGTVVAAASEKGGVVTNGMSEYKRNSGVANAALLVNTVPADFGNDVLGGIEFQRKYENLAFRLGGGDYRAPVQSVGDFLRGKSESSDFLINPTYKPGTKRANLHDCLPAFVSGTLKNALVRWDERLKGFAASDVPLTGVEMRSSAPCRIIRDKESFEAVNVKGLYPIGEGAGYAGGIMSAAVDGLKATLAFLRKIGHTIEGEKIT